MRCVANKSKAGARAGHAAVHGSAEEKLARWTALANQVTVEKARGLPTKAAVAIVAERHGCHEKTVRRAIKRLA